MKVYHREEMKADYYDHAYATNKKKYPLEISGYQSQYIDLYQKAKALLTRTERIVELGCGTGQLAEILLFEGYNYIRGVDFSKVGIDISTKRCNLIDFNKAGLRLGRKATNAICNGMFQVADLYKYEIKDEYNTIISLEVLEHIEKDILVINKINQNKRVIFSLPMFANEAHVRFFVSEQTVIDRYAKYFNNLSIEKIGKIFLCEGVRNGNKG